VRLASRGQREVDGRTEMIEDAWLAGQLRRQGREIQVQALLGALALTAVVLLVPS